MSKKALSTYEREIKNNPNFKKEVEKKYQRLVLAELNNKKTTG